MKPNICNRALSDWLEYKGVILSVRRGKAPSFSGNRHNSKEFDKEKAIAIAALTSISPVESIQLRAVSYSVMKRLNSIVSPPPASNKRKNCESKSTGLELLSSDEVEFLRLYQIELAKKALPPAEPSHEIERKESMRLLQLEYLRKASLMATPEQKQAERLYRQNERLLKRLANVKI